MRKDRYFIGALAILALLVGSANVSKSQEKIFIHLTDNFKKNDGPVCVAFNAAMQALRDGAQVEIFFDQEAAYALKQWAPGKTDLGLYPLPDRIKTLLSQSFGIPRDSLPANYQEYLKQLHDKGAIVTVNGFWNALTQIEETIKGREHILTYVEPLTLDEFMRHRKQATTYWRF